MQSFRSSLFMLSILVVFGVPALQAQISQANGNHELYGGYTLLSNSFNTYGNFSGTVLNGWEAAFALNRRAPWGLTFDGFGYYGTNLGDPVREHTILAGPHYALSRGKESLFIHGLAGFGHINSGALRFDNSSPRSSLTFAMMPGLSLDSRISGKLAWRFQGDFLYGGFCSKSDQIHGLPTNFGRFSTGPVWRF